MDLLGMRTIQERIEAVGKLAERFHERAAANDEAGRFPFENIEELKKAGYTRLTVPKAFGGGEIPLCELVRLQETIATGDGSTALAIGWHMGLMMHVSETQPWEPSLFEEVAKAVMEQGALLNTCATEAQTGSPTRGGKPTTTAVKKDACWVLNGRKTFATMSPVLDFFIITATIEETGEVGSFIVPGNSEGLSVVETWDSIALKATGSHDVVLEHVKIPLAGLAEVQTKKKKPAGYLLHVPACYLGIAEAAKREAAHFAKNYIPNSLNHPIAELPAIRQKFGEMELKLMQSRHFLYSVARMWDEAGEAERSEMGPELGAVKLTITNQAIEIVDLAMRIAGARSLSQKSPLQRYYRDVRAGLHNPPMDDVTMMQLAARV
ncbi:acyl-CoA dehydrogenase family protein [Heyndrickxia acidiproducens]|uniref:acyl-CoA dehydrogenase family protein n=1 Tax=Heyndrickxia acidiproducens TaxID=1121084 RepID=UPI00037F4605|nr:acyl-CoA dehydrogenase family protein [Heyndrickxia acidiproducens]